MKLPVKPISYKARRNALIPEAENHADKEVSGKKFRTRADRDAAWNLAFHSKMNELAEGL